MAARGGEDPQGRNGGGRARATSAGADGASASRLIQGCAHSLPARNPLLPAAAHCNTPHTHLSLTPLTSALALLWLYGGPRRRWLRARPALRWA